MTFLTFIKLYVSFIHVANLWCFIWYCVSSYKICRNTKMNENNFLTVHKWGHISLLQLSMRKIWSAWKYCTVWQNFFFLVDATMTKISFSTLLLVKHALQKYIFFSDTFFWLTWKRFTRQWQHLLQLFFIYITNRIPIPTSSYIFFCLIFFKHLLFYVIFDLMASHVYVRTYMYGFLYCFLLLFMPYTW